MAGITAEDLIWARAEADRLAAIVHEPLDPTGQTANFVGALEFLRLRAGVRSEFYLQAVHAVNKFSGRAAGSVVAQALLSWIDFVDRGIAEIPVEAQARVAAATDLMEQVDRLLHDRRVHPAAPVMLAGAALEELLRSLVDTAELKPRGKPGISSYATALREAGVLSSQEVKDVTAWGGMRNDAAHGEFDQIKPPHAQLMAQGINLFMQKRAP